MNQTIDTILALVASELGKVSLTSALVIIVLWLARSVIEVRLKSSVQREFDTKSATLRSELRQQWHGRQPLECTPVSTAFDHSTS
jgi:hypothetical protein